jgi:hypothetical protein
MSTNLFNEYIFLEYLKYIQEKNTFVREGVVVVLLHWTLTWKV